MSEIKKAIELLKDEAFIDTLKDLEDAEAIKKAFEEKDIQLSIEDVIAINDAVCAIDSSEAEELDENKLEEVSGGIARYIKAWQMGKKAAQWFVKAEKKLYSYLGIPW